MCFMKRHRKIKIDLETLSGGTSALTTFDRLSFKVVKSITDEYICAVADEIRANTGVLADFTQAANDPKREYMLQFLSGVVYALSGKVERMSKYVFLFGSAEAFRDGSLDNYIQDNRARS